MGSFCLKQWCICKYPYSFLQKLIVFTVNKDENICIDQACYASGLELYSFSEVFLNFHKKEMTITI